MAVKTRSAASTAWKIVVGVLVALLILVLLVEFGLRWFLSKQMVDQFHAQAQEQGVTAPADPEVSFGSVPLVVGLAQGELNEMTMKTPSTLQINGTEIKGQPEAEILMEGMTVSEDPVARRLVATTNVPDDFLLATVQAGITQDSGMEALGNNVITDIHAAGATSTLDVQFAGGLATLSLLPSMVDGALQFEAAKAEIFGFELPEQATAAITESLTKGMKDQFVTGNMKVQEFTVNDGSLRITMVGNDVKLSEAGQVA